MSPEEKARLTIERKLRESGWTIQDFNQMNRFASLSVAVREFPTSTGEADYALFVDGIPVGVVEAKRTGYGEKITTATANLPDMQTVHSNWPKTNTLSGLLMRQRTS